MNKQTTRTFILAVILLLLLAACSEQGGDAPTPAVDVSSAESDLVPIADSGNGAAVDTNEIAVEIMNSDEIIAAAVATIEAQQAAAEAAAQATAEAEPVVAVANEGMDESLQNSLIELYDTVNPSVVFILVSAGFGAGGSGSGFVYDSAGHVVTNNHVVEGASIIEVVFADGTRSRAEIVGTDVDSDLAVIRVDELPESAPPLPLSSIEQVDVGQFVIAIGNPFGEQGSMSLGIVSGLGRSLLSQRADETGIPLGFQLPQVIQTDAPINPGNSGGPLLNLDGEVVGVNSAIRTETGTNSGVGFSIPVDAVARIAPSLIANGVHEYPFMGVNLGTLDIARARELGFDRTTGAYIAEVRVGTPAAQAGLQGPSATRSGDLIIQIDDRPINSFDDLNAYLVFNTTVGQTIDVLVIRDGEEIVVPLTLGARP